MLILVSNITAVRNRKSPYLGGLITPRSYVTGQQYQQAVTTVSGGGNSDSVVVSSPPHPYSASLPSSSNSDSSGEGEEESTKGKGVRWAMDNDCWGGFNRERWLQMLFRNAYIPGCLWAVVPDVVANAEATLQLFRRWQPVVADLGYPAALVAQNGLEQLRREIPWSRFNCLFIGGDTHWKLSPIAEQLIQEAQAEGKWIHVGRVNSQKRLAYALAVGADSVDGTGLSRFSRRELPPVLRMCQPDTLRQTRLALDWDGIA